MRNVANHPKTGDYASLDDRTLVQGARLRDPRAIREITVRHNQRLYRAAWSVLRDHSEAEEVVQDAYLSAFAALDSFKGESSFSTWLVRIAVNAAIDRRRAKTRRRQQHYEQDVSILGDYRERAASAIGAKTPYAAHQRSELAAALTQAIDLLPPNYGAVFVLREVEEMPVRDVAAALGVSPAVVKTRHVRARRVLRRHFQTKFKELLADAIDFGGVRCKALTERVIAALETPTSFTNPEGDHP